MANRLTVAGYHAEIFERVGVSNVTTIPR